MKKFHHLIGLFIVLPLFSCTPKKAITSDNSQSGVTHPEWSRNAVIYEVNLRQYTNEGTIKAFQTHLSQLKELGVDILWLMPVNPISELNRKGKLGSYYAVKSYKEVNPEFGTVADLKEMVKKAHEMGFKVILDWVANHTGCDNIWVKQHPDWYVKDSLGKIVSPFNWTDTYKLDYKKTEMRAAMIDAMKFWVKECDIDGYRCDVAFEVPTDFWNTVRKELDSIKPVFMLAEAEKPELTDKAFDMAYNWPLKDLMGKIAKGANDTIKAQYVHKKADADLAANAVKNTLDIDKLLAHQDSIFPKDAYLMNHITNHDLNSWEGTEFVRLGDGVKAFAVLTYTLKGMPLIYTGQEVGMNRALKFFEKDKAPDWTKNEMFAFYKKLNELKHTQAALAAGEKGGEMVRYHTTSPNVFVFARKLAASEVLVYLNLSKEPVALSFKNEAPKGDFKDYFVGKKATLPTNLAPWEYKIFVK
jgi:alpha-amylase